MPLTLPGWGPQAGDVGHRIRAASPRRPPSSSVPSTSNGWVIVELLIGGRWTPAQSGRGEEVTSPCDGAVAGAVPVAGTADVDAALAAAVAGAKAWRNTPGHERM